MLVPTDYADIFVAAVEGGINYWAAVTEYDFNFGAGAVPDDKDFASARITEFETQESKYLDSRTDEWHNAVAKAAEYFGLSLEGFLEEHDAGMADVAVQFALFGEVVYG